MKTTKLFFMAALALMTAACSNDDNDLTTQQPQKAEGITITAQLAPKTNGATTRAVSEGTNKIVAEWAVNEHIAILYTKDETKYAADATITAVDGDGAATITFTVEAGTPNNTACTLVYPLSAAKDDHTGVKDAATLLAAQNGTLNANLDVRVGAGTIQTTTPGLTVTTQPEAQFAIFKFTTKNSGGTATIDVNSLTITIGAQDYVITPASATSELYAALPPISSEAVTFTATGSDSKTYTASKASVTFAAGKYYQSNIKLTEVPSGTTLDNTITAWTAGSYAVPAGGLTYSDAITVSGDVTLVLTDGETLTLNKGISLAEGATLTVQGTGSMAINGTNGNASSTVAGTGTLVLTSGTLTATGGNGQNGWQYGTGAAGGAAINGTVIVDGGTLTATGGNGGYVGDVTDDSLGGAGGAAISGSVTVNGGTLTATGGNGGNVGNDTADCCGGAGGAAIGGSLTINAGTMTTTNGAAGSVGSPSYGSCQGGAAGKAVAGTVTDNR